MAKRKSLDAWINDALVDPDKDGKITMMSLVHMVAAQQQEIHCVKFGSDKTWEASKLAELFRGKAEAFAQDLPGTQMFMLMAWYGTSTEPQSKQPFSVSVAAEPNGLYTEAPTEQGKLQMKMRWEETHLTQIFRRQQVLDDYTLRLIEHQSKMLAEAQNENRDAFNIVKEMMREKITDDHTRAMERLTYERSSTERKQLLKFAPALANTVFGREIFPQSTADTALVEAVAEALMQADDKAVIQIAAMLGPTVAGPLMNRLQQIAAEKAADKKEREALAKTDHANGKMRPEDDAAGEA